MALLDLQDMETPEAPSDRLGLGGSSNCGGGGGGGGGVGSNVSLLLCGG